MKIELTGYVYCLLYVKGGSQRQKYLEISRLGDKGKGDAINNDRRLRKKKEDGLL